MDLDPLLYTPQLYDGAAIWQELNKPTLLFWFHSNLFYGPGDTEDGMISTRRSFQ